MPLLPADAKHIQLNPAGDLWTDVATFTKLLQGCVEHAPVSVAACPCCLDQCQQALTLYQGDFLAGFSVRGCAEFETWLLAERAYFLRQAVYSLQHLVTWYVAQGNFNLALPHARHRVELDSLDENAQQKLMQTLACNGQRTTALAQFESYQRLLHVELAVAPATATIQLYQQIQDDALAGKDFTTLESSEPAFLSEKLPMIGAPLVFVSREPELAQLQHYFTTTLDRTGEAGFGKTALLNAFAQAAQATHQSAIIANGNGNAHTGIGDPYLPFCEVLA